MRLPLLIYQTLKVRREAAAHSTRSHHTYCPCTISLSVCIGVWSLRCGGREDDFDDTVILTFVGQTM